MSRMSCRTAATARTTALFRSLSVGLPSVPHARIDGISQPFAAVATSKPGFDFPDVSAKVHVVFMVLIPRDQPALYLKVLRGLGTTFGDPNNINLVAGMMSAGEIFRFFESGKAYLPRFLTAADIMTRDFCSLSAEFCACYGSDIIVVSTRLG